MVRSRDFTDLKESIWCWWRCHAIGHFAGQLSWYDEHRQKSAQQGNPHSSLMSCCLPNQRKTKEQTTEPQSSHWCQDQPLKGPISHIFHCEEPSMGLSGSTVAKRWPHLDQKPTFFFKGSPFVIWQIQKWYLEKTFCNSDLWKEPTNFLRKNAAIKSRLSKRSWEDHWYKTSIIKVLPRSKACKRDGGFFGSY